MIDFLTACFILGLAGGYAALFFRALPWPASWLASRHWAVRKVWDCVPCAGGRGTLLAAPFALAFVGWPGVPVAVTTWLAASAVATMVYRYVHPPQIEFELP